MRKRLLPLTLKHVRPFASSAAPPPCLVLSNGVVGAEKQALALASAVGLPYAVKPVWADGSIRAWRPFLAALPSRALLALNALGGARLSGLLTPSPPYPRLAISCGRAAAAAAALLREASGGATLTVHVQRPPESCGDFDLVVAPRHDFGEGAAPENVVLTEGSLHQINSATLDAARVEWAEELKGFEHGSLAVLVGGAVSRRPWQRPLAPTLTAEDATALAWRIVGGAKQPPRPAMVSTSRRTPQHARDAIKSALSPTVESHGWGPVRSWVWDPPPPPPPEPTATATTTAEPMPKAPANPYLAFLAAAEYILVTADSINMVCEAVGTGKPVYVLRPEATRGRFKAFHDRMLALGHTRRLPEKGDLEPPELWIATPPDDTGRAAARVRELLRARFGDGVLRA